MPRRGYCFVARQKKGNIAPSGATLRELARGKLIKAYNRNVYYAVKYALMLLILYLIFF